MSMKIAEKRKKVDFTNDPGQMFKKSFAVQTLLHYFRPTMTNSHQETLSVKVISYY